jgi:hypothetical protein
MALSPFSEDDVPASQITAGTGVCFPAFFVLVFLSDKVNEVYAEFFSGSFTARSCIEVSGLAKGAKVEVEAIALVTWSRMFFAVLLVCSSNIC